MTQLMSKTSVTGAGLRFAATALLCMVLAGCTSLAGIGGVAEYGCKAPDGVRCDSVSNN